MEIRVSKPSWIDLCHVKDKWCCVEQLVVVWAATNEFIPMKSVESVDNRVFAFKICKVLVAIFCLIWLVHCSITVTWKQLQIATNSLAHHSRSSWRFLVESTEERMTRAKEQMRMAPLSTDRSTCGVGWIFMINANNKN